MAPLLIVQYSREQVGGHSTVYDNIINTESRYTDNKTYCCIFLHKQIMNRSYFH